MITYKKFGWVKDTHDLRDFRSPKKPQVIEFKTVSLFDNYNIPPVYDQGELGDCVSNSIAGVVEFKLMNKSKFPNPTATLYTPSRLFNYYYGRAIEGTINIDSGLQIRDGLKALAKKGISDEHLWPYDISKFTDSPSDNSISEAKKFKGGNYVRNEGSLSSILESLNAGNPVIFGFLVFESFMSETVAETGEVPMPNPFKDRFIGGHCVDIWGYNKEGNYFLCRNSWGKDWGINGYFHIPVEYVTNPMFGIDFWTLDNLILK